MLKAHILKELCCGMKPHVIAGRLKRYPPLHMEGRSISHETIFQWIYEGKGRFEHAYQYLIFQQRKRRKRKMGRRWKKACIPERTSIHARPEGINERREYGHWETDSMVFRKQKPRLSVQYERKSKYVVIHRHASYQKGGVEQVNGIIRRFLPRDTDMNRITQQDIYAIQETINNIPRRSLGCKTPKEIMAEICGEEVVH